MHESHTTQKQEDQNEPTTTKALVWEVIKFFLIAALIVIPVRVFIAQPFLVDGPSMEPTFSTGDYLIVDQLTYRFREPERGEIAIIRDPRTPGLFLIKRIIGLPHETVSISNGKITITSTENPIGIALEEPYILYEKSGESLEETLNSGQYFVMGDNRAASLDSRFLGPIKESLITGRALLRLFPPVKAAVLPGSYSGNY